MKPDRTFKHKTLPIKQLRTNCLLKYLKFKTTKELVPLEGIVNQHRAVEALQFGLDIKNQGFNIYVAGMTGTGKNTVIKNHLERIIEGGEPPSDWCYVNNFDDSEKPKILELPASYGKKVQEDVDELIKSLRDEIPKVFESEDYVEQRKTIIDKAEEEQKTVSSKLEIKSKAQGFAFKQSKTGFFVIPLIDGEPIDEGKYNALNGEEKKKIEARRAELEPDINKFLKNLKVLQKNLKKNLEELDKKVTLFIVNQVIGDVKEKYANYKAVIDFLDEIKENVLNQVDDFREFEEDGNSSLAGEMKRAGKDEVFQQYKINVFVDNTNKEHPPVMIETNPTYPNIFGRIEKRSVFGTYITDFTMIKPGAIARANGGYLVFNAMDILMHPGVWDGLKRVIKTKELRIEDLAEMYGFLTTSGIKPEPIPVDVKFIIIGNSYIYHLLYMLDEDFKKLFKIKADFDHVMKRSSEHIMDYAQFIGNLQRKDGMPHFDKTAVAKVVEYGSRIVDDREKLSARFSEISDIIREAGYWAKKANCKFVSSKHVNKAFDMRVYRSNLVEDKLNEMMDNGTILVDTEGAVVGQVNGLAVYDMGDYSFGKPSRITVSTYAGKSGVINIERESKMSGKIHDKGVLILNGFLGSKFAAKKSLSLTASICFEQSYGGVDGDSASSTELYALFSSLSDVPIKQGIAVTGSMNQKGEIQPIGGINEKIEGYFTICKIRGLTGEQGVIMPQSNVRNLMLKEEVVEAVNNGKFHIWSISHVDEGIEILTGQTAGKLDKSDNYKKDSIYYLVNKRLCNLRDDDSDKKKKKTNKK